MSADKSKLQALANALREDRLEIVLSQHATKPEDWDLSALYRSAGPLKAVTTISTLLSNGYVVRNGVLLMSQTVPMSGLERRRAKS